MQGEKKLIKAEKSMSHFSNEFLHVILVLCTSICIFIYSVIYLSDLIVSVSVLHISSRFECTRNGRHLILSSSFSPLNHHIQLG